MSLDTFSKANRERTAFLCEQYKNHVLKHLEQPQGPTIPEIGPEEFSSHYRMSEEESLRKAGEMFANSCYAAMEIHDRAYLLSTIEVYRALMENISDPKAREQIGRCIEFSQEQSARLVR